MYKKLLRCLMAVALVLVSGGVRVILPVNAGLLPDEDLGTITTMNDFADDSVMVVLTHEASLEFVDYTPADFAEIGCAEVQDLSSAKGAKVQAVLRGEQLDMSSVGARFMNQNIDVDGFRRILCLKLANPGKGNVLRAVMALEQREDVLYAEPNYIYTLDTVEPSSTTSSNDLNWGAMKIQLEDAWEIETGSDTVLVGVLDTGIDASHPALDGKIKTNMSCNFTEEQQSALTDRVGHGTFVAGVIGAMYNTNALRYSGVNQNVQLVSLRVITNGQRSRSSEIANAINFAESRSIPLLNLSLRATIRSEEDDAILFSVIENYSGLLICAAGNDNDNINQEEDPIPAVLEYDNIITVGASTSTDHRASLSNYGEDTVDLFAPGVDIVGCWPHSLCSSTSCSSEKHVEYGYHIESGTSIAAPFVTGTAALILAHNPYITPAQLRAAILDTVDQNSALDGCCASGGRLNAFAALYSPYAHYDVDYTYINSTQHRRTCLDCGCSWMEDHEIHPGLHRCIYCYPIPNE